MTSHGCDETWPPSRKFSAYAIVPCVVDYRHVARYVITNARHNHDVTYAADNHERLLETLLTMSRVGHLTSMLNPVERGTCWKTSRKVGKARSFSSLASTGNSAIKWRGCCVNEASLPSACNYQNNYPSAENNHKHSWWVPGSSMSKLLKLKSLIEVFRKMAARSFAINALNQHSQNSVFGQYSEANGFRKFQNLLQLKCVLVSNSWDAF